jgi:hypothetical protein
METLKYKPMFNAPGWHCPQHRIFLVNDGKDLRCAKGHSFPIKGGVPRFVASAEYAESFDLQWQRYFQTQLDCRG